MIELGELLRGVTAPVMGCTEPAAVALATAVAAEAARGRLPEWAGGDPASTAAAPRFDRSADLELIGLRISRNLFKNGMAVGLPNTGGRSGLLLAAALGAFLEADDRLNLLKATEADVLAGAQELLAAQRVHLEVDERDAAIFVEARVIGLIEGERHVGEAVIHDRHDGLTLVRRDGQPLLEQAAATAGDAVGGMIDALAHSTIEEVVALAHTVDAAAQAHLLAGARMNRAAARLGLEGRLGLGMGAALQALVDQGRLGDGLITRARIETAAAADARMSGGEVEIMASGGSGNQGIMAAVPVAVAAEHLGATDERLAQALALGHLVTALMTAGAGLLGGMCGCVVKAGVGASAAVASLLADDVAVVEGAVNNMAGNIVGEICDGAKVGCAVKLCTAAGAAVEAALLAQAGLVVPHTNGIVGRRALETLRSIGELARGMHEVDRRIVEVMRAKA